MATYHQRLRAALDAGHPTNGAYSGGANAAADEQKINAIDLPGDRPITEAERAIRESGKWTQYIERSELKETDGTFTNPSIHEIMSAFQARTETVNYQDSYWAAVIDAAVSEGSMGPAAGQALKEWSNNQQSHAQLENLGTPSVGDIQYAWSL